jgi:hypothetical protein
LMSWACAAPVSSTAANATNLRALVMVQLLWGANLAPKNCRAWQRDEHQLRPLI